MELNHVVIFIDKKSSNKGWVSFKSLEEALKFVKKNQKDWELEHTNVCIKIEN